MKQCDQKIRYLLFFVYYIHRIHLGIIDVLYKKLAIISETELMSKTNKEYEDDGCQI